MSDHNYHEELRRQYKVSYAKFTLMRPDQDPPDPHTHALVFPLTTAESVHVKRDTIIENVPDTFAGRINPNVNENEHPLKYIPEIELLLLSMLACSLSDPKLKSMQYEVGEYWKNMFTVFEKCVTDIQQSNCPEIIRYRAEYHTSTKYVYLIPSGDVNYRRSRFHACSFIWTIFATIFGHKYADQSSFYYDTASPQDAPNDILSPSPSPRDSPKHELSITPQDKREPVATLEYISPDSIPTDPIPPEPEVEVEEEGTHRLSGHPEHTLEVEHNPRSRESSVTYIPEPIRKRLRSDTSAHVGEMPETHTHDTVSSLLLETPSENTDELIFPNM